MKKMFYNEETIKKNEKWFNFYSLLPVIISSIALAFLIWGIIDCYERLTEIGYLEFFL